MRENGIWGLNKAQQLARTNHHHHPQTSSLGVDHGIVLDFASTMVGVDTEYPHYSMLPQQHFEFRDREPATTIRRR